MTKHTRFLTRHAQPDPEARAARRALVVGRLMIGGVTLVMLLLVARVMQLQTIPDQRTWALRATDRASVAMHTRRGGLTDSAGRLIATSRVATRLFVDPAIVPNRTSLLAHLGAHLGYDPAAIERLIDARPDSRYIVIDDDVDNARLERLREIPMRGLSTETWVQRDYPNGALAGQVVGFINDDGKGIEGVEMLHDDRLRGDVGRIGYVCDRQRSPLWIDAATYKPAQDGEPVRLSLDLVIQKMAEEELAAACRQYAASSGQMIVMDPHTGEIIAMANHPAFDPNAFRTSKPEQWRNRCVTDAFEPGSIFKPFIWAKLLEDGYANPTEMFDTTEDGVWRSARGRRLRDSRPHGRITWDNVLVYSSNIGMAIASARMGNDKLHATVRSFGFGASSGSGLPGEAAGIVNPLKKWTHYSESSIPMGQEIAVTTLQIARAFCAIANGGLMVQPTIMARDVHDPMVASPVVERVLSEPVAEHTRLVLGRVMTEGTGQRARSRLYDMFGKTGTAQVPDPVRGGYAEDQYIASFLGGAPLDRPRLIVACVIHRPDKSIGYYGGTVAGPPARNVLERALIYLGVPTLEQRAAEHPQVAAVR